MNFAFADTFTGNAQPLNAEFSECSVPPAEIPSGSASAQVVSQFQFWSCREYRSSQTRAIYFRIEMATDGEYIHLIPAHGRNAIDLMDYRYTTASVFQTCSKIREATIAASIPLGLSKCNGQ